MSALVERIAQEIRCRKLFVDGDRVAVAVSGGPDSVALLHVLATLRMRLGITVVVAHVDHQLRPESASDARFVEELARRFGLNATIVRRDVLVERDGQGWSLEDAARRVRYAALDEIAHRYACNRLAVAHTADDQAETVLLRLLRGSGVTGLSAMTWSRPLGSLTVVRPLLGVWRRELEAYLAEHDVAAIHDQSNNDPRFVRNRIRHELLPWLESTFNPNIKPALTQLAQQCHRDATFLEGLARRQWKRLVKSRGQELVIRLPAFRRQPLAVQCQVLRLAVRSLQGDLTGFEYRHWQEVERLCAERPTGSIVDLPGGLRLRKTVESIIMNMVEYDATNGA
jgi:tRNA(Ile)-lysidine synthase